MSVFFEALSVFCGQEECTQASGIYCGLARIVGVKKNEDLKICWRVLRCNVLELLGKKDLEGLIYLDSFIYFKGFGRCTEMTSN